MPSEIKTEANIGIRLFNGTYLKSQCPEGHVEAELGIEEWQYPFVLNNHKKDDGIKINSNYV